MSTTPRPPLSVVLYTRENCPLCDEMRVQIRLAGLEGPDLRLVDIDRDSAGEAGEQESLRDRFGWRVPVLEIDGRIAFEGRCEASQIVERVARMRADAEVR